VFNISVFLAPWLMIGYMSPKMGLETEMPGLRKIVGPAIPGGQLSMREGQQQNKPMKGCTMKKRSFGLVLLVVFISITLAGCGCFQQKMKGETPPPPAPVVQAPPPPPACPPCPACPPAVVCPPEKVCPPPPACPEPVAPKKDRN